MVVKVLFRRERILFKDNPVSLLNVSTTRKKKEEDYLVLRNTRLNRIN